MKKLMTLMLGLSIAMGSVAMFAQNTDTSKSTTKKAKKKSSKKPAKDTTKTT